MTVYYNISRLHAGEAGDVSTYVVTLYDGAAMTDWEALMGAARHMNTLLKAYPAEYAYDRLEAIDAVADGICTGCGGLDLPCACDAGSLGAA